MHSQLGPAGCLANNNQAFRMAVMSMIMGSMVGYQAKRLTFLWPGVQCGLGPTDQSELWLMMSI